MFSFYEYQIKSFLDASDPKSNLTLFYYVEFTFRCDHCKKVVTETKIKPKTCQKCQIKTKGHFDCNNPIYFKTSDAAEIHARLSAPKKQQIEI